METPLRKLHEASGATLSTYFGCLLPEQFTHFAEEYRAARETVALLDANYRAFAWLSGPDRVRYLNAVVSNNIKDLAAGQGTRALLLNPQGHILAELECFALPERLLLVLHASERQRTFQTLDKYIIMDEATLEDTTDQLGALAVEGPQACVLLRRVCGVALEDLPELGHCEVRLGSVACRLIRRSECGHQGEVPVIVQHPLEAAPSQGQVQYGQMGALLLVARESLPALWEQLRAVVTAQGGLPVGYAALNALRLESGIPWFGYDFDDRTIPHEAGLEATHVSFSKGCYTGQEIVERVRSRGHVNRRRVGLQFTGQIPPSGAPLLVSGKEVGQVTSTAFSPALGRPIGMGYVRREHSAPGGSLEWSGGAAEVIELPLASVRRAEA